MTTKMLFVAALVSTLALPGCAPGEVQKDKDGNLSDLRVLTDQETGCQYITARTNTTALTPRIGRDGKQICV